MLYFEAYNMLNFIHYLLWEYPEYVGSDICRMYDGAA